MQNAEYSVDDLIYLMQRLRNPETGCPWDLQQDYRSIAPSTIEEAYEVADAIEREDYDHLKEELGDLLFQVVFYGQLAEEENRFSFHDIVHTLTSKLVRRHPHVFPQGTLQSERCGKERHDNSRVNATWEAIKQQEREEKGSNGVFDDVPLSLPGLIRAAKLQKRAAKFGFDWREKEQVLEKIQEEVFELRDALVSGDEQASQNELGDLLFTCVNMARHLGKDPESLVREANGKFERRFSYVESKIKRHPNSNMSTEDLDKFWQEAKRKENT